MCDAALSHLTRSPVTSSPRIPRVVAYPIMMARHRVRPSVTQRGSLLNNNKLPSVDTLDLSSPFPVPHCVPCNRGAPLSLGVHFLSTRTQASHPFPSSRPRRKETDIMRRRGRASGAGERRGGETLFAEGKHREPRSEQGGESKDERIAPPGD
jgi:hypothetical protein